MPGLYALGQHQALARLHAGLQPGEGLFAFLDDVYLTSDPERTLDVLRVAQTSLPRHANVQIHLGKTRAWNAVGEEPPGLVAAIPPGEDGVSCWRGDWSLPAAKQGLLVLGSPLSAPASSAALFARLPDVQDLQCAWLLLLFCAAPRWTYLLRSVPPADTASFAAAHDEAVLECLGRLLSGADTALAMPPATAGAPAPLRRYRASARGVLGVLGGHHRGAQGVPPAGAGGHTAPDARRGICHAAQHQGGRVRGCMAAPAGV